MDVRAFRVACGEFIGMGDLGREEWEQPGKALVPLGIPYAEGMIAARMHGTSMEPKYRHGDWGLFHLNVVGTREDRIVLVEDQSEVGVERYTLKKYRSHKNYFPDGTWDHDEIVLLPLNPLHAPIRLKGDRTYQIIGWLVGTCSSIERVDEARFRDVTCED